jgi:hypothetical protein
MYKRRGGRRRVFVSKNAPEGQAQEQAEQMVPEDQAVLEVQLPPGAKLEISGKDMGSQRRFTFRPLTPGRLYPYQISARFRQSGAAERTILVKGGWRVQLPLLAPQGVRPELVLQTGHTSAVSSVAFSPDGRQVLTGSSDHSAILWDAGTGQKLRSFSWDTRSVDSVAFSPDGRQVLTGMNSGPAILWDAASGQKLRTFAGGGHVTFRPDGRQVLTDDDEGATLWDVATGAKLRSFQVQPGMAHRVDSVAFSPDGRQVLTGLADDTARRILGTRIGSTPSMNFLLGRRARRSAMAAGRTATSR